MAVEVRLFGFGGIRPKGFHDSDIARFDIATPTSPRALLNHLEIDDATGMVMMRRERLLPQTQWDQPVIADGERITLMWAIEGG